MEAGHSRLGGYFGEYECLLAERDVAGGSGAAITFSRELFSREFVVRSAISELATRSASHSRISRGHVVVSVDGVPVRGMSSCQFDAIWLRPDDDTKQKQPAASDAGEYDASSQPQRQWRVHLRDRKRAELAVDMEKECASRSHFLRVRPLVPGGAPRGNDRDQEEDELSAELREIHERIWRFELDAAHAQVRALPCAADPLTHVLELELELARAMVSHDSLEVKKARVTASQTATWLDQLADLSSLSHSCHLLAKTALAETLLMRVLVETLACALSANALLSAAGKVAVFATCVRRSAALYCELQCELQAELGPEGGCREDRRCSKRRLNETTARELEARVRFGVAALRLCGSFAWSNNPFEWLSSALLPAFDDNDCNIGDDPSKALQASMRELFACVHTTVTTGGRHGNRWRRRRNWAELLLLLVGPSAVDAMAVGNDSTRGDAQRCYLDRKARFLAVAEYRRDLQALRARVCCESPRSPLLLWAAGAFERAASCLPGDERAHVLRFDAGRAHFERHEFEEAMRQFASISKCSSAPSRLRGFSSVFLAVGYLATAPMELLQSDPDRKAEQLAFFRSMRVLLRCADRCLAAAEGGDTVVDTSSSSGNAQLDPEASCLRRRLRVYLKRDGAYMLLLPVEILYVLGYRFNGSNARGLNTTVVSQHSSSASSLKRERHARMLRYLDAIACRPESPLYSDNDILEDVRRRAEWMLLRAIVLFNMRDTGSDEGDEVARPQLEELRALLITQDAQSEAGAELQRSFVAPVALFYELQLRLLARTCVDDDSNSASKEESANGNSNDALWRWWRRGRDGKPSEHAYAYLYDGKVRALRRLVAARASSSLGSCDSTSSDGSAP